VLNIVVPDNVVSAEDVNLGRISPLGCFTSSPTRRETTRRESGEVTVARRASTMERIGSSLFSRHDRGDRGAPSPTAKGAREQSSTLSHLPEAMSMNVSRSGYLKKRRETDSFRKRWCVLRYADGFFLDYFDTRTRSYPYFYYLMKLCYFLSFSCQYDE
jgi:hypothetical protein